ncbi:MAG: DUF971 domain-containing protein [Cellvibrionaceae bacterium]|nr:DUF971 domain-containing protein [Cellvibrionaceae bacterium]
MKPTNLTKLHLHKQSKTLTLVIDDQSYQLSAEFLRVHSPSAEVQGHGPGQAVLVDGKLHIGIAQLKTTGNYGVLIVFDDGHNSGIYTWDYLAELCTHQAACWQAYLDKLKQQNKTRDPDLGVVKLLTP